MKNEEYVPETDFIRIRQEKINETVEAVQQGLDLGNINLTHIKKMTEAKVSENDLYDLLDDLKENISNEEEKQRVESEFEKLLVSLNEEEKKA